jgi:1-acyl-sn-glycerol-3-phosphate acyltransferase
MKQHLARVMLRLTRWNVVGERPTDTKYVLIAAPHTSNWDLLYMLLVSLHYGVRISWLGKHSLFRGPLGPVMRALGGIPVRRDERTQMVADLAGQFRDADRLVIAIPPEGTRGRADWWKSGFYRVAEAADVPIICSYLDYPSRTGGFGPSITPTGDVGSDMDEVRAFYSGVVAKYPDHAGPIRLRAEEPDASA